MTLQLADVRTGRLGTLNGKPSGIRKQSVEGPVPVGTLGLEGDQQGDTRVHGGPEKAVHLYPRDHYATLREHRPDLADQLEPGVLGENLSVAGITEDDVCVGDHWRIGSVLMQVSQPRRPCWRIDARLGSEGMVGLFNELGTTGWYFRVLEPGTLQVGDAVELVERPSPGLTLRGMVRAFRNPNPDAALLRRYAACPGLPPGWVERLERRAQWAGDLPVAAVITVSDRSARGEREDLSGPAAADMLTNAGFAVTTSIVPDGEDAVAAAITEAVSAGARLVVTSGGTGIGPHDRTPEGTARVLQRELPGIAALLLKSGLEASPHAALSRGVAGVVDTTLVVNLPGKPAAVREGLQVLLPIIPHALDQLAGGDH